MPLARVGNRRLYYELRGNDDAPLLVMLRGLGRNSRHWGALCDELEPHLCLLLIDNRGAGRSDPVRLPFTTAGMSDDVATVLDAAGIARGHLFGMSLGGMVAQRFALDHGGRLDRLVLGCTSAGGWRAGGATLGRLLPLLGGNARSPRAAVAAQARTVLSAGYLREHPEIVERWLEIERQHPTPPATVPLQLLAAAAHDCRAELAQITAPTLVVSAEADALVAPENSRAIARGIPGSELAWLPGSGHDFPTEHPAATARILLDFLLDPRPHL